MFPFKIDLNISNIYKIIKIEIPTWGNQNTQKGGQLKYPQKEQTKTSIKRKKRYKTLNNEKKKKTAGLSPKKKDGNPLKRKKKD